MKPKLPIKFSYKVTDTFYAGEYPFEKRVKDGIPKLQSLIDFGIKTFVDLTSNDSLTPYAEYLPKHCTRLHFPTQDYTGPDFPALKEIHTLIDEAESRGEKIYVHCKGGYDRTGVVVATYFVYAGFPTSAAKLKFYQVFVPPVRGRYAHQPFIETKWELLEQYQEWLEPTPKANVEINHNAVRLLWEGLNAYPHFPNAARQQRRVLYMPYVDGHVNLHITDAAGKFVALMKPQDLIDYILPEKFIPLLPKEIQTYIYDPELDER